MGILAWVIGILGGLCAAAGVINAFGLMPPLGAELTTMFWLVLSVNLFLVTIAFTVASTRYAE